MGLQLLVRARKSEPLSGRGFTNSIGAGVESRPSISHPQRRSLTSLRQRHDLLTLTMV